MWAKVAEEMQIPWRAAEAMHWQLGETDMARRAGVVPFTLTAVNQQQDNTRSSPSRGHVHSHSQGSLPRSDPHLLGRYPRGPTSHVPHHQQHHQPPPSHPLTIPPPIPTIPPPGNARGGSMQPRRESMPLRPTPEYSYEPGPMAPGPGLPPLQTGRERGVGGGMQLPSVAELTTGVSPYSTPAYSLGGASASPSATASPRTSAMQGPPMNYSPEGSVGGKRGRSSPDSGRETARRRH